MATIGVELIHNMPRSGLLLLLTHLCLLCHSSPVDEDILGLIQKELAMDTDDDLLRAVSEEEVIEDEIPEELEQIPGFEHREDGLYFKGAKVSRIMDLGSDDDDDEEPEEVVHDDDGVIEPDVGWQTSDSSEVTLDMKCFFIFDQSKHSGSDGIRKQRFKTST